MPCSEACGACGSPPRAWGLPRGRGEGRARERFTPTCVGTASAGSASRSSHPVHPHVRGDCESVMQAAVSDHGSPPRAWGLRVRQARRAHGRRFTPTCVGTASARRPCPPRRAVHPHVRGDCPCGVRPPPWALGSPPRAWGLRRVRSPFRRPPRFTPTCVGTAPAPTPAPTASAVHPHVRGDCRWCESRPACATGSPPRAWGLRSRGATSASWATVHPHVRGDCWSISSRMPQSVGSPPRAWGLLFPRRQPARCFRFTPTCVGTAAFRPPALPCRAVHPHVRGDCEPRWLQACGVSGSPPRAWGLPRAAARRARLRRFTPTCVGTASYRSAPCRTCSVHPHVRGDCVSRLRRRQARRGSPPRAWGLRLPSSNRPRGVRFTPTCVGTASPASRSRPPQTVHPHVRGDCICARASKSSLRGSPPRAWGLLPGTASGVGRGRFTPTCVGTARRCGRWAWRWASVHPHVRGDCAHTHLKGGEKVFGSPPRAWGLPEQSLHRGRDHRFTPTCVGTARR